MQRSDFHRIDGLQVDLRLVEVDDADYIWALRTDPRYSRFLSPVEGSLDAQYKWLSEYKLREKLGEEFYYIIERHSDGQRCGVIRLYGLTYDAFSWGSWILDQNKPPKAALEAVVLLLGVGFNTLERQTSTFDVRCGNDKTVDFYRRLGATEVGKDSLNYYFRYTKERYDADLSVHMKVIQSVGEP